MGSPAGKSFWHGLNARKAQDGEKLSPPQVSLECGDASLGFPGRMLPW